MDFRMNTLTLTQTRTLVSFNECQRLVSSAEGDEWFRILWWLRPPCWDTKKPPFSVSHVSLHTLTTFFSIHPEFTGETAVKKTQEPFSSFVGGCNGKEMVSVPIVSHGKCRSVFRWHQHTYIHSHTHTMGEDRSLGKARKTKESPSVQSLRVGVHERLQAYTLKTLWCFMWKFTRKRLAL